MNLMDMNFKGLTAIVTGGGRRLGRAIALSIAENGADMIIHYNQSRREAREVSEKIKKMGRECHISEHNLIASEQTETWFDHLVEQYGCPDILINSASVYSNDTCLTMSAENLHNSINLHVYSPLVMIRKMYQSGNGGSVINILDTRVMDRDPSHSSYHFGKRGLLMLTRDLAEKFAPDLRINAVAPGLVLPPEGHTSAWSEKLKSTNPLKASGTARDVCDAVLFLIQARFITGQIIFVDGGRHLKANMNG